jgi:origin recognition complex subunit 4
MLQHHYYTTKSASAFMTSCILPISTLSPDKPTLDIKRHQVGKPNSTTMALSPPDSKLHLLQSLSDLDLALLIAAARLDIVAHTDTVNFAMAYDEYGSLMGKQRVQSANGGAGGMLSRVWGRGVAAGSWERLVDLGLLVPAGIGGGGVGGKGSGLHGGLEGKMWKVDVKLEEIPGGVKLGGALARWCREI